LLIQLRVTVQVGHEFMRRKGLPSQTGLSKLQG
jgi:hypothetical protein